MKRLSEADRRQAEVFIHTNARVLERRRYEYLFHDGPAQAVVDALQAYRNDDGGYGHALEPDGRGPGSQPVHMQTALTLLDEAGELRGELAGSICDYLESITAPDGGLPIVHPNIRDYPRPEWWGIPERYEGFLIPTGTIVGLLHKNHVDHPWLARATKFCVDAVTAIDEAAMMPYTAMACVNFLDHTPARAWAEREAKRIGELARARGVVRLPDAEAATFAGFAEGERFHPHDVATTPDSLARAWFTDAEMSWSLDNLVAAQGEDGGWPVPWGIWTPVVEFEWRPYLTIDALVTLRAYGRLD